MSADRLDLDETEVPGVQQAFDRLRGDVEAVCPSAALPRVRAPQSSLRVATLAAAAVIGLAGLALLAPRSDGSGDVRAGEPEQLDPEFDGGSDHGSSTDDAAPPLDDSPTADSGEVLRLANTQWDLKVGAVPNGPLPAPEAVFSLDFGPDGRTATGQAHCNLYGVGFGALLGGVGPSAEIDVDGTPAPCRLFNPAVGGDDFVAALLAVDDVSVVDGELILRGPDIDLRFWKRGFMGVPELLLTDRANTWVDVHGYLGASGDEMFLCSLPPDGPACAGFSIALVGETPDPALIGTAVIVRGALDRWARFVVDPDAELRQPAPDTFDGVDPPSP